MRPEAEQPEVVMVGRVGQPQERGIHSRLATEDGEAQDVDVERERLVEIRDEENRVIEAADARHGRSKP